MAASGLEISDARVTPSVEYFGHLTRPTGFEMATGGADPVAFGR